jgi:hypothetical protein
MHQLFKVLVITSKSFAENLSFFNKTKSKMAVQPKKMKKESLSASMMKILTQISTQFSLGMESR